eukprot:359702-Chlamydomonas_euryale.AAC.2
MAPRALQRNCSKRSCRTRHCRARACTTAGPVPAPLQGPGQHHCCARAGAVALPGHRAAPLPGTGRCASVRSLAAPANVTSGGAGADGAAALLCCSISMHAALWREKLWLDAAGAAVQMCKVWRSLEVRGDSVVS